MRNDRLNQLEQLILQKGTVSLEYLRRSYGVSMNTIRRDMTELIKRGNIEKVYGGVCAKRQSTLLPYKERHVTRLEMKKRIGCAASDLLAEGDIIYLDSGTTTLGLIPALQAQKGITVITGNLSAIEALSNFTQITLIATGGQLDRQTNSFVGPQVVQELKTYNIQKSFLAATGVSVENGVTNSSLREYDIKRTVVAHCEHNYLLVDSTKFGPSGLTTYAKITDFEAIVTDQMPEHSLVEHCRQGQTKLLLAD